MVLRTLTNGRFLWGILLLLLWREVNAWTDTPPVQQLLAPTTAPVITIWYGDTQKFGTPGNPQTLINILGNVSDADGMASLKYSLNGSSPTEVSIGNGASTSSVLAMGLSEGGETAVFPTAPADNPRLVSPGDFNIEISTTLLISGVNTIVITGTDTLGEQAVKTVVVQYTSGQVWPLPYWINWAHTNAITEAVEVVDGQWVLTNGGVKTAVTGYDRLLALGDITWDDFEITVPITIHNFPKSNTGGVGILARWQSHFVEAGEQPGTGWWNLGAYAYYRNRSQANGGPHLVLRTGKTDLQTNYSVTLTLGTPYYYKLRVQTKSPGLSGFYSFKVWPTGQPEPATWYFEVQDGPPEEMFNGSVLLVAHEADVTFGDVTVLPLIEVMTGTVGNGSLQITPILSGTSAAYVYGDVVTFTATPASGWLFSGWSGDMTGQQMTQVVTLTQNVSITAVFEQNQPPQLATLTDVNIFAKESVTVTATATDPNGTIPTLTASPVPDGAQWTDNGDGTAVFQWTPTPSHVGQYTITVTASDGVYTDTENFRITVQPEPNQPPQLNAVPDQNVFAGETISLTVSATDPNGTIPTLTASPVPDGAQWTDNGDGTAVFQWTPTLADVGQHTIMVTAFDGEDTDTTTFQIIVSPRTTYLPFINNLSP